MTAPETLAITGQDLRSFMRRWPGGVAVVTSASGGVPAGCTVNSFISVSLRPPLVLVCLALQSKTLAAINECELFGINVLTDGQRILAERFAAGPADRFAGLTYQWKLGIPLLDHTCSAAVCRVERSIAAADHAMLLGRPLWCAAGDRIDPLVFAGGTYWALLPTAS
jgi:3-hydroxy-9,10-secoandrosta-1,3,5(10)-triene-9,17-dione monooxygenase reductase component